MDPTHQDRGNNEREVDLWLDAALGQYSKVEPRTGLEHRVLANLQSERNRIELQRGLWWAAGTVTVAAVIVAVVWLGKTEPLKNPVRSAETAIARHGEDAGKYVESVPQPRFTQHAKKVVRHRSTGPRARVLQVVTSPKLDQFPSQRSVSRQELLLIRYLQENPNTKALLEARVPREALKTESLEIQDLGGTTSDIN